MITRGVRNNNPGNIDYNPRNKWEGQTGIETGVPTPRFANFVDPESGIRALAKLLLAYRGKDGQPGIGGPGIDTVREIINRWAPSVENNTDAYVRSVSAASNVRPDQTLDIKDPILLGNLVTAIIAHENGYAPYTPDVIAAGVTRALA